MKRILFAAIAVCALVALPVYAGEYHTGQNLFCYDCHTPHFSMQHGYSGGSTTISATNSNVPLSGFGAGYDWMGNSGPNLKLLKMPANELCLACHDGQLYAPDVLGAQTGGGGTEGRSAGHLNDAANGQPYTGHTLDSASYPPGYNLTVNGTIPTSSYDPATGKLECISCHIQHGSASSYRNLGNRTLAATQPQYTIGLTQTGPCRNGFNADGTFKNTAPGSISKTPETNGCDVWIKIDPTTFTPGASNFLSAGYYDTANVFYTRNHVNAGVFVGSGTTVAAGTNLEYDNRMDAFCGSCHSAFHGKDSNAADLGTGPNSWTPGMGGATATGTSYTNWLRHPTGMAEIGGTTADLTGTGGESSLMNKYLGKNIGQTTPPTPNFSRVKVYATVQTVSDTADPATLTMTGAVPGCVSCHKAHGNDNPFGLVFLARGATAGAVTITENGGFAAGQTQNFAVGQRNLCGQCHSQGN